MKIKLFLFVVLLCMLQAPEVESHDFFKHALNSVKNVVVKGYHHVANIFVKNDSNQEDNKMEEIPAEVEEQTTPLEQLIDIRFKETDEESVTTPSFRRQETNDDEDAVPDLNTRFFINVPCGDGTRRSGNGCRQVINK